MSYVQKLKRNMELTRIQNQRRAAPPLPAIVSPANRVGVRARGAPPPPPPPLPSRSSLPPHSTPLSTRSVDGSIKVKKMNSLKTDADGDMVDSSDEEEPRAWEHPEDLDSPNGPTSDLNSIIISLKDPLVVWDNGGSKLGKESEQAFLRWITAYSKLECQVKRDQDDMYFNK